MWISFTCELFVNITWQSYCTASNWREMISSRYIGLHSRREPGAYLYARDELHLITILQRLNLREQISASSLRRALSFSSCRPCKCVLSVSSFKIGRLGCIPRLHPHTWESIWLRYSSACAMLSSSACVCMTPFQKLEVAYMHRTDTFGGFARIWLNASASWEIVDGRQTCKETHFDFAA